MAKRYHLALSVDDPMVKHLVTESRMTYHVVYGGPLGSVCGEPAVRGTPSPVSRVCVPCFEKAADKRFGAISKSIDIV